jgi:succinate-semialdehyde dehydrogenase / glutarate-semialdehyde dehydrogenase
MAFASINPSTGALEATFAPHTAGELDDRLSRAFEAFMTYRSTSFEERARSMNTVAELLEGELPAIAHVVTSEMGKPFAQAKGEVAKCAMTLRWYATNAAEMLADDLVASTARHSGVHYQPLGPVLAVMPWNFPLWQVIRFAAPTLMAGNVGLLKHAENVPQTALVLEDLFRRAGYPAGVFTNLFVEVPGIDALIDDERIAAVTLTGSERAGRAIGASAGRSLKKCVLELGGSDPFVVLGSADLDRAVPAAVQARVQNNGQSCIAAKRFIVVEAIAQEFEERFVAAMAALNLGDPFDPATDIGPLVSSAQRNLLAAQVDDAVQRGARLQCGGHVPEGQGCFYPATVLTDVDARMRVGSEEVFGPVAVVERVADAESALTVANATSYGLGASVWTSDPNESAGFVEGLESGMVFVNAMVASMPELPFGGVKRSGFGRELSSLGIREFCNAKSVWIA